jgi:type II secretory ATPase GspE/PulE/Tfp pilus assembly ATPase PilB-like protein
MDPDETKRLQSGRCKLKSGGRLLALQIVISPTDPGENIILRISDAG